MSQEITTIMESRARTLWLTDHPDLTVSDYDRVRTPRHYDVPDTAAARREHSAYLKWFNTARVLRLVGLRKSTPSGEVPRYYYDPFADWGR
jgi:hypothetical protein